MKYVFVGVVRPERAAIACEAIMEYDDGRKSRLNCHGSQLVVSVEGSGFDGYFSARLAAHDFASSIISAKGFSLGQCLTVEIIQYIGEGGGHFFGADPIPPQEGVSLKFEECDAEFTAAGKLACQDVFFRFALKDYLQAMVNDFDCAVYCYRAVESIRGAFDLQFGIDKGWSRMHEALGTSRAEIDSKIKDYAAPIRHGAWHTAMYTDLKIRWEMLSATREVLERYRIYCSNRDEKQ